MTSPLALHKSSKGIASLDWYSAFFAAMLNSSYLYKTEPIKGYFNYFLKFVKYFFWNIILTEKYLFIKIKNERTIKKFFREIGKNL